MAEKKISQLTAKGATVADTDLLVISESAGGGAYNTKSVTGANVKALVTDANLTTTDITTNNVSTSKHGFAPKAPNDATQFLDGTGAYDTVKDSDLSLSDITTNDVSTTKHGFAPKAPNDTAKFLRGDATWATVPAGGLTKFTEAEATTSPNNTVYVDSLTAAGSTTNVDIAIVPKGTGAFMLDIPDNTAAGGNKRGAGSVDLQMTRSSASQVVSGSSSFAAGQNNTVSADAASAIGNANISNNTYAFSCGNGSTSSGLTAFSAGSGATASGDHSIAMQLSATASGNRSICLGAFAIATGTYSVALAQSSQATAESASALGSGAKATAIGASALGAGSTANATSSTAVGNSSHVFGIYGRQAFAGNEIGTAGDCQKSHFFFKRRTTGNTATTLTTDNTAAGTTNQVILSNQSAYRFKGSIVGKQQGSVNAAVWDIDGFIVRGANAAATTLNVSNVTLVENTPAWGTPTLAADTTNGGLQVQVTGAAATNIQWTAVIETTEVIYA